MSEFVIIVENLKISVEIPSSSLNLFLRLTNVCKHIPDSAKELFSLSHLASPTVFWSVPSTQLG